MFVNVKFCNHWKFWKTEAQLVLNLITLSILEVFHLDHKSILKSKVYALKINTHWQFVLFCTLKVNIFN